MTKRILTALPDFLQRLATDHGKPCVQEEEDMRILRFNAGVVQSAMRVSAPFELDLSYTRCMMGFLLFNAEPHDILLVGLGGGSLSKYCYRQFPQARITTLEINPDVIALRDQFLIPPDDDRFRILQADASEVLARGDLQADIILLDGYDAAGLPAGLCSDAFYTHCWQALDAQGVLVANLWGGEPDRAVYLDRLRTIFDGRVWWSRPEESSSLIVFAIKNELYYPQWSRLTSDAQALDRRYRLNFLKLVRDMRARPDPDDF